MKQKLFLLLLLFASRIAVAETSALTIQDLTKGCGQFYDFKDSENKQYLRAINAENGTEAKFGSDKIRDILELNVVSFFEINGYETELKRELYKETEEYKEYETALKEIRNTLKKQSFCYIHKLRNVYNLEKNGFPYEIQLYGADYDNFPEYINHGTLCIEYSTKRFPKNKMDIAKVAGGGRNFLYIQQTYFPVLDKRVALQIEEAGREQVGVLFIFKIDSTKVERPGIWPQTFILTKTESIYLVNTQTGEVYCKVL